MKDRFEVLDIFRGIFSAMVVFFHMSAFAGTPIINNNFVDNSDLFVDFFFVLSGFVIAYTYRTMENKKQVQLFLKKRFSRLYPLHILMLLIFVGIQLVKHFFVGHIQINNLENVNNNWTSFFTNIFLINSVKVPAVNDVSWNIPSWSISAEMISYIIFAAVLLLIYKLNVNKYRNYFYAFIVLAAALLLITINGNYEINYSYNYGFLRGAMGFFTGVLCLNAFMFSKKYFTVLPSTFFHITETLVIAAIVYFIYEGKTYKPVGFIYEAIFFIAVLSFSFEKGFISAILKKSSFLKKMGTYSYSIYMIHALLLSWFNILFIRVLHLPTSAYSYLFIINYALIYIVSSWTYKNIEMRFSYKKKLVITPQTGTSIADKSYTDKVIATQGTMP